MRGREGCPGAARRRDSSAGSAPVPVPTPGPARPLPLAPPPPQLCSPNAGPELGQGVRGGVKNACRARTDNTCEAVSTPPAPRLQTAHLQRTWNFNSPHPPGGGRARAPGAGRDPHTAPSGARGIARPVLNQPAWAEGGRSERREERK